MTFLPNAYLQIDITANYKEDSVTQILNSTAGLVGKLWLMKIYTNRVCSQDG